MNWALDILIAGIMLLCCLIGYIKGFAKSIAGILTTIAAGILALIIALALAEPIYDSLFRERVNSSIQKGINTINLGRMSSDLLEENGIDEHMLSQQDMNSILSSDRRVEDGLREKLLANGADPNTADSLSKTLDSDINDRVNNEVNSAVERAGLSQYIPKIKLSVEDIKKILSDLYREAHDDTARFIGDKIVRPAAIKLIRIALWLIFFVILSLLFRLIILLLGIVTKLPGLSAANRFGGLAIGALKGLLYCFILGFAAAVIVRANGNSSPDFNSEIIGSSYVFSIFFNIFY
ncbi:MAG: CvpA family protein [Ruminococcus sp.]|nr:CvpA family protein [Ruminococcus sp.]